MYMYGPAISTGENHAPVRLAKSLPKTLSFNPISGTLNDTTTYWNVGDKAEPNKYSSVIGNSSTYND
jgi:hypothetical protein